MSLSHPLRISHLKVEMKTNGFLDSHLNRDRGTVLGGLGGVTGLAVNPRTGGGEGRWVGGGEGGTS